MFRVTSEVSVVLEALSVCPRPYRVKPNSNTCQSNRAPPPERADSRELDPDVIQVTPMRGAARCDLFFVRVIRVLAFARPFNVSR